MLRADRRSVSSSWRIVDASEIKPNCKTLHFFFFYKLEMYLADLNLKFGWSLKNEIFIHFKYT